MRDRRGLEEARNLDTVIFDKTGTLTLGEFRVVAMSVTEDLAEDEALRIARNHRETQSLGKIKPVRVFILALSVFSRQCKRCQSRSEHDQPRPVGIRRSGDL